MEPKKCIDDARVFLRHDQMLSARLRGVGSAYSQHDEWRTHFDLHLDTVEAHRQGVSAVDLAGDLCFASVNPRSFERITALRTCWA
jgi:hypothetical protein